MKNLKRLFISMLTVLMLGTTVLMPLASAAKKDASAPQSYKQALKIVATAYAPGPHDNGKWGSLTHLGTQVRPGVIAVDPRVIPLGSRVYIEFPDGHGVYARAEDTGGAIKGNRIDIAMWTVNEAYDFGMQDVRVYILD
jgi:3D (Asp-Asp-Asp) domain-containing protein